MGLIKRERFASFQSNMKDRYKIEKRIKEIQSRIYDLNDRLDSPTLSNSEVRKIEKIKTKLYKEKDKLIKSLYSDDFK
jgi:hypothetical protein